MKNTIRNGLRSQRGFTLLELMVATTISVFLLGGLFATLQSTRQAYAQQTQLAQLQDNQRLAMTLIASVVESAGYFPNPAANTSAGFMPSGGVWTTAGQSVLGTANTAAPGDTLTVRYGVANNDNVFNCRGAQNSSGADATMVNTFKVVVDASGIGWLVCNDGVKDYQLVRDVTNMQIVYGVHLGATSASCTDTYRTSTQMVATPANWAVVCSVTVTLTFNNRVSAVANATVPVTRTIAIMNTAGVNT
jgi:type IV pilus assembly protein PilW